MLSHGKIVWERWAPRQGMATYSSVLRDLYPAAAEKELSLNMKGTQLPQWKVKWNSEYRFSEEGLKAKIETQLSPHHQY